MTIGKIHLKLKYLIFAGILVTAGVIIIFLFPKKDKEKQIYPTPFLSVESAWADTTIKYLSVEEKIGQLIIYDAGKISKNNSDSLFSDLYKFMPGGIIFNTDSLNKFVKYQNNIQKISKINLLTICKSETGIPEFIDINSYPDIQTLLSIRNDSITDIYVDFFAEFSKQLNISFNILPEFRSSSNDSSYNKKYLNILLSYNENLKDKKIISCLSEKSFFMFDSTNFEVNNKIFKSGLSAILPNYNNIQNNEFGLTNNIKTKYNFGGLSAVEIKDADLTPESILNLIKNGAELFITDKPEKIINNISNLLEDELITEEDINYTVRKILLAKTWTGVDSNIHIEADSVISFSKNIKNQVILRNVLKKTITSVKNNLLPFMNLRKLNFKVLNIGEQNYTSFKKTFSEYSLSSFSSFDSEDDAFISKLKKHKKKSDLIILFNNIKADTNIINAIFENNSSKTISLINFGNIENLQFADSFNAVIQVYGNSEIEQKYVADAIFGGISMQGQLPVNINDSLYFGKSVKAKKVRVSRVLPEEEGLNSKILSKIDSIANDGIRRGAFPGCQVVVFKNGNAVFDKTFGYHTYAKQRRVRKTDLYDLASITKIAATTLAAMRLYDNGRLRLNNNLGRFFRDTEIDYSNIKPDTIFNIDTLKFADVKDFRKILRYQDTIHLNDSVFVAFDTLIVTTTPGNNIFKVKIRDLLLHKSGITPTLPILPYVLYKKNYYDSLELIKQRFYKKIKNDTLKNNADTIFNVKKGLQEVFDKYFTRKYIKDSSETKIANSFFLQNRYFDTLWRDTKRLRVYSRKIYQYADINMILLQQAIDSINRRGIDRYLRYNVYQPMGLNTMCYKPTKYFSKYNIVPTENDKYWREQVLRGNVHDPSAALLGRVSGNAGLFSDAYDLALLGQMWLNGGSYGGMSFISKKTVQKFTGFQEDSHRGLGFDKPGKKSIIGKGAPPESYGHTGFTGTCIWVDPVNDIVYVFLSNRVYPSAKNWRINRLKIRQKIHTVVYDAIIK
ncbi:MAG: serine hydrolase [Bacteroidales bacterium]|nr:serine hydrolase [Bacteroidales bacterium]